MVKKLNPFKLWGSYLGAFIYAIGLPFLTFQLKANTSILVKTIYFPFLIIFRLIPCNDYGCIGYLAGIYIILAPIIGFFAGYYIHRYFKT